MAVRNRAAMSVGAPDGGSSWDALDETVNVISQNTGAGNSGAVLGATAVVTPIGIIPQTSGGVVGGNAAPDALASGQPIATLEGGQLFTVGATLAAQATMATGLIVIRAGAVVGGTIAFGWRATAAAPTTVMGIANVPLGGDAGTPAFTQAAAALQMPAVAANTALVNGKLALQPGDLIALVQVMQTGTLATPQLAASMKVV